MTLLENMMSGEIVWHLGWTLLHFIWQAAALALVLAIIFQVLRKSAASLRYGVACLILVVMAVLPIATLFAISVASTNHLALTPLTSAPEALALETSAPFIAHCPHACAPRCRTVYLAGATTLSMDRAGSTLRCFRVAPGRGDALAAPYRRLDLAARA